MQVDFSIASLVLNASWLVKFVMAVLLLASLWSWTVIFAKRSLLNRARKNAEEFETRFWNADDLAALYSRLNQGRRQPSGMEKIFEAGFKEFARLRKREGIQPMAVLEGAQRAMRVALNREIEDLETHLPFFASVGSVSPYIGLFGTVWGIMNAFRGLDNVGQATLAHVAPGIAEALVATAMGLFAAIPAVIAFNHFVRHIERLSIRFDSFMEEFSNILQRQANSAPQQL